MDKGGLKNKLREKMRLMRTKRTSIDSYLNHLEKIKVPEDLIEPILRFRRCTNALPYNDYTMNNLRNCSKEETEQKVKEINEYIENSQLRTVQ